MTKNKKPPSIPLGIKAIFHPDCLIQCLAREESKTAAWMKSSWGLKYRLLLFFAGFVIVITSVFTPHRNMTHSMYPTIDTNQFAFVNKTNLFNDYERGDIVAFKRPDPTDLDISEMDKIRLTSHDRSFLGVNLKAIYIKRIIATEGDTVKIVEGKVYVNNALIEEAYVKEDMDIYRNMDEITIPKGQSFVMGDNRNNSFDSRSFGSINNNLLEGEVIIIF